MTRRYLAAATAVAAATVGATLWNSSRSASPPQAAQVAATPGPPPVRRAPYDPQQAAQNVAFWQGRVRYDPQGAISYSNLAGAYMALQRETGDIGYAIKAEQAARLSLKITPSHAETRRRLSRILLMQHRFGEALAALKNASPEDTDAQRLKVDLFVELGDYASAQHALGLSPPQGEEDANYYSLRARLLAIHGQPQRALADVRTATAQASANIDAPPESIAWYHWSEARVLANMGRGKEAAQQLKQALQIFPRDYRAMNFLAHIAANDGDWKGAVGWARQAEAIVPEPDTVALLGDAYIALGQRKQAAQQFALVEAIARLTRARGMVYDRPRALFYADHNRHLAEALALAQGEMKLRHDIYSYDTLAWVSYKNGLLAPARQAAASALAFNTQDAMLWYHAGVIAQASGHSLEARRDLQKALAINPRFHPSAPLQARALLARLEMPNLQGKAASTAPIARQAGQAAGVTGIKRGARAKG